MHVHARVCERMYGYTSACGRGDQLWVRQMLPDPLLGLLCSVCSLPAGLAGLECIWGPSFKGASCFGSLQEL